MTTNSEIMDFGGLQYNMKSLSLGHPKPGQSGNLVYDGSDDSVSLPGTLSVTGNTTLTAALISTAQTLTGAGAVNITSLVTFVVTTGADALTLADGAAGQIKIIVMKTDGGAGTLTPSNLSNGTTITFDDVGDSAILVFDGAAWAFVAGNATLA